MPGASLVGVSDELEKGPSRNPRAAARSGQADAMRATAVTFTLPAGATLTVPPEVVDAFEAALRAQRRVAHAERDLAAEIEAFLANNGPATVPEIGRATRARDADVREVLRRDRRFARVLPASDRSPKAKPWSVVSGPSGPGPASGTSARNEGP